MKAKVSPRNPIRYPYQDIIQMETLRRTLESIYPKLPMSMRVGKLFITIEIHTNPAMIVTPTAKVMANILGCDVEISKHIKTGCRYLMHVLHSVGNKRLRVKIYLHRTCKKGKRYTTCLDQTGRRPKGVEVCEINPTCSGKTPKPTKKILKH